MRVKSLILAIAALAALAGCNDTGSNAATGPSAKPAGAGAGGGSVDPCSLLTTDQATAALGTPAKAGVPNNNGSLKQCQWDAAQGPTSGSIAILVYVGGQKAQWSSTVAAAKAYPKFSEVPGLGDAAFTTGFDVHVLKGDNVYQIGVAGGVGDPLSRATTVAKEALAKV
jgi:hypothetical protein